MFDGGEGTVHGEMNIPQPPNNSQIGLPDFNTLNEPIKDTIVSLQSHTTYQ